ncbi:hypothetical protein M8J75_006225 [Diaphorina citri]|nr:hypothetical protein M8J75_006225 [Diaphorina citri]
MAVLSRIVFFFARRHKSPSIGVENKQAAVSEAQRGSNPATCPDPQMHPGCKCAKSNIYIYIWLIRCERGE